MALKLKVLAALPWDTSLDPKTNMLGSESHTLQGYLAPSCGFLSSCTHVAYTETYI